MTWLFAHFRLDVCVCVYTTRGKGAARQCRWCQVCLVSGICVYFGTGMLHSGQGATSLNAFLSTLNIPPMHHKTLKRREREAGGKVEDLAKRLCNEAVRVEREMSGNNPDSEVDLTVSYDAAWNKRGSGRCYNSLSGKVFMINASFVGN